MLIKLPREARPIAEIEADFPDHWILIDQPVMDEQHRVLSGISVQAGQSLDVINRKCAELGLKRFAVWCTKKPAENVRVLL